MISDTVFIFMLRLALYVLPLLASGSCDAPSNVFPHGEYGECAGRQEETSFLQVKTALALGSQRVDGMAKRDIVARSNVPSFDIDLDLPAEKRWTQVAEHYKTELIAVHKELKTFFEQHLG